MQRDSDVNFSFLCPASRKLGRFCDVAMVRRPEGRVGETCGRGSDDLGVSLKKKKKVTKKTPTPDQIE